MFQISFLKSTNSGLVIWQLICRHQRLFCEKKIRRKCTKLTNTPSPPPREKDIPGLLQMPYFAVDSQGPQLEKKEPLSLPIIIRDSNPGPCIWHQHNPFLMPYKPESNPSSDIHCNLMNRWRGIQTFHTFHMGFPGLKRWHKSTLSSHFAHY